MKKKQSIEIGDNEGKVKKGLYVGMDVGEGGLLYHNSKLVGACVYGGLTSLLQVFEFFFLFKLSIIGICIV